MHEAKGFDCLSDDELFNAEGGSILVATAGIVLGCALYYASNEVCEDLTGKMIGKFIADALFPAN